MLSAFVCPGVGQYFQGRWFAALVYFVSTLALMLWLLWISVVPLYRNVFALLESTDPAMGLVLTGISLRHVGWTLLWILMVYLVNVLDIVIVNRYRMRNFTARTTPPDLRTEG